ncbi:unnamed protein product [Ambrosiozyma monospora]|uniref:Unnamed protein product n=1 Tax=Ambrosiozyma monospora TaxID=43982 RepID=A0ACB5UAX2_AMBMO|nr:unnamed protein product [Ambrosiozyma monospora]
MSDVVRYNYNTYSQMRSTGSENNFVFHDAFQSMGYWDDYLTGSVDPKPTNYTTHNSSTPDYINATSFTDDEGDYYNTVLDHHHYEVFGVDVLKMNITSHLLNVKNFASGMKDEKHPALCGEWSAALTDCAWWLNGVNRGSRYADE